MKKRAMSLLLVLLMVVTLFPTFALPAAAADDEVRFRAAVDPTSGSKWTATDIYNYKNGPTTVEDAVDNTLYVEIDGVYYPVGVEKRSFYQQVSSTTNALAFNTSNFPVHPNVGDYGVVIHDNSKYWYYYGSQSNYFVKYNNEAHRLYYDERYNDGGVGFSFYQFYPYFFSDSVEIPSSYSSGYARNNEHASWYSNSNVVKMNSTSNYTQAGGLFDDQENYGYRFTSDSSDYNSLKYNLYSYVNSTNNNCIYYTKDGVKIPLVYDQWSGAVAVYDGTLYIKTSNTVTDPDPVETDEPNPDGILNPGGVDDAGFKLQKELTKNEEDTYDIKMQSYSTANTVKEGIVEKVPTDFVVIVDQSGSMKENDMATGYDQVGTKTLEECAAGSYYYKDGDTYYRVYATRDYLMEYHASESKWTQNIIEDGGMSLSWFQGENETTFSQANQYYYKTSDGVYRPVHVSATGKIGTYYIKFYYENANGQRVDFVRPSRPVYKNVFGSDTSKYGPGSFGYGAVNAAVLTAYPTTTAYTYSTFLGITTGMYVNYPMYTRHLAYSQLCYRDVNGVEHIVPSNSGDFTAEYCNSSEQAVTTPGGSTRMSYNGLYEGTGYERRIDALKGALTEFVKAVADETDTKPGNPAVDNRIAIVGFSSLNDGWSGQYNNTEILTGEDLTVRDNNGVYINSATTNDYKTALLVSTQSGDSKQYDKDQKKLVNNGNGVNDKLDEAIDAITANGGTQPEYGFQMAKSILDNRTNKTYTFTTGERVNEVVPRNTIVIFFTDGQPGDYDHSDQYSEANDVVAAALPLKNAGVKVFSIGVFGESDGNPLTYNAENDWAKNASGQDVRVSSLSDKNCEYLGGFMGFCDDYGYCLRRQWRPNNAVGYTPTANDTIYDYMSVVSSNYPNAQTFIADDWIDPDKTFEGTYVEATDDLRHKDTAADTNQFYRMAANQATLVSAFKQSVSYASVQQQNTGVVNLNTTSIFRDEINTADFDISNATYSVTWQPIYVDRNLVTESHPSAIDNLENDPEYPVVTPVVNQPVPENGIIEYTGFDYGANYVSWAKTKGYKLIVTVNGIVPTTYNQTIKSNADDPSKPYFACGIYEYGKDTPEYSVQSPTLYVAMHEPENRSVDLSKSISELNPEDGSYTVTLQAYAKGNSSGETVALDKDAYLLDVINMDNLAVSSELSQPTVRVYALKGTADESQNVTFEADANRVDITDKVDVSFNDVTDASTGRANLAVKITGFDYNANYIGNPKPMNVKEGTDRNQGKKIIVEIGGLVPTHPGSNLTSNINAGVYDKQDTLVQDVESPKFNVGSGSSNTYVIDFSAPMTVATEAKSVAKMSGENGEFSLIDGNVVYQLNGSVTNKQNNLAINGVDMAFALAKPVGLNLQNRTWSVLTMIPAGSVYFDDDFAKLTEAVDVGDGSGYNAQISASPAEGNAEKGIYTFTFYGTGIDVYCTTDTTGGYVSAKLTQNGQAVAGQPNQTIRNYDKEVTRYNVPSISFTGLPIGEYTLTLQVLGSSNYKLDGVRVYNPADPSAYEGQDTHEQYAAYINMREALVNDHGVSQAFTDDMTTAVLGALFVDDSSKLIEQRQQYDAQTHQPIVDESGEPVYGPAYKDLFEAYQKNSPKHEIYLDTNDAILFQLSADAAAAAANGNLWIGLSAPDATANGGTVEGMTQSVKNAVDMYYPITSDMIGANRVVTIKNTGSSMISVTNLKITGNETIYNAVQAAQPANSEDAAPASLADAMPLVFEQLTMQAVKIAANNGVDPDAPADPGTGEPDDPGTPDQPDDPGADKPTWTDPMSLLKTLFQALLNTLGNLFKGLGGW